ncbi:MAG: glycosyltransferase family 2 protein [Solirubrobacterales bacterium]
MSPRTPRFTAVIAAYNEEDIVADAIRSVLAQTEDDFELIVVDDGSVDRTADVVRSFESDGRLRLISQENRGLAASLNTGIAAGGAPYIALLDADDLWMPTYLERMGAALDSGESVGLAYTEAWWYSQQRGRFFRQTNAQYHGAPETPPDEPEALLVALMPDNWMFGLTAMRRSVIDEVGGFEEQLRAGEDYDLWIRILAAGYRAVRAPGRLAIQRDRAVSMSTDESSMATAARDVYARAAELAGVPEEARAIARQRMAEFDAMLEALSDGGRNMAVRRALRARLGRVRKALLGRWIWHPGVPGEVAGAFPDLDWGAVRATD